LPCRFRGGATASVAGPRGDRATLLTVGGDQTVASCPVVFRFSEYAPQVGGAAPALAL
jgi:hypothetical protein